MTRPHETIRPLRSLLLAAVILASLASPGAAFDLSGPLAGAMTDIRASAAKMKDEPSGKPSAPDTGKRGFENLPPGSKTPEAPGEAQGQRKARLTPRTRRSRDSFCEQAMRGATCLAFMCGCG